jgi:hypothetical protein
MSRPGPQRLLLLLLLLLRRRDERRVCFGARRRPVWGPLVTCGRRVDRRRRVLVLVLVLLMTVRVRLRLRREPRLGPRLEHVTGDTRELVAVRRQMRIREALLCLWVGQYIRWDLLRKRLGRVRGVQLVDERRSATATEAARRRRDRHTLWLLL